MKRNRLFLLWLVVVWTPSLLAADVYYWRFENDIQLGSEKQTEEAYLAEAETAFFEALERNKISRADMWIVSVIISRKMNHDRPMLSYEFHAISFRPINGGVPLKNPRLELVDAVSFESITQVSFEAKDLVPRHWYPYLATGIKEKSVLGASILSHISILKSRFPDHYLKIQFLADAATETLAVPIPHPFSFVTPLKALGRRIDNALFHCATTMVVQNKEGRFEW